ncbi:hypothetical protein [uncultured Psychroserpens sp.]|uniref:hypothetical protein n=1 Tax=uncultured Psychroserpens sp. TaxID=255436 RepID=UPI00260B021C|nr:hypothetical protein [uncultured Psychroserpens sp.]
MKTRVILLIMYCIVFVLPAQNDTIKVTSSKQYYDSVDAYVKTITVNFGTGVFIPQGKLQRYFGNAPLFELNANFPLKKGKSIDGVFQFVIPNQQDDFLYLRTIDTVQAKSTLMFNLFLRFKKSMYNSQKSKVDFGLGIGASTITTDARNPFYSGEDDENKYELITAFLLMPGVELKHKFSEHTEFTFSFDLQYSPYKIEGALREDIGTLALIPKISYRF